jgi:hypothetical protein
MNNASFNIIEYARTEFGNLPQEECEGIQRDFETLYGKDKQTRTRQQWRNLINKYGIQVVMQQDSVTKAFIKEKLKPGKLRG